MAASQIFPDGWPTNNEQEQAPRQASAGAGAPPPPPNNPNEKNRAKYENLSTTVDRPNLPTDTGDAIKGIFAGIGDTISGAVHGKQPATPKERPIIPMKGSPCKGSRGHFDAGHV